MGSRIRERLTFANVMSVIAVFIALGGSAVAIGLRKNSVHSKQIANNSLKNVDVRNNALRGNKINESTLVGVEAGNITALHVDGAENGLNPCTTDPPAPPGITVEDPNGGGLGACVVTFPQSVFDCAVLVSPDHRKTIDSPSTILQETAQVFRHHDTPREVLVTSLRDGSIEDRGFSLEVIC